jgi:dihydroflavonol-4-reductase
MTTPTMLNLAQPILVTGATGFAGGRLACTLAERGCRVRALVRPGAATAHLAHAGIELVEGQLTRREDVLRAAAGTPTIFHIAAAYRTARQPDSYYHDVNVRGTEHILEAAQRRSAVRLVHCSTVGVHGHIASAPADEDAPIKPGDVYQHTKALGEQRVREAIGRGVPAVIARPAAIYGPGDMRLLKLFRAIQRRRFIMFGSGSINYHLVHVDDLVEGFILCAASPQATGGTFILAGPRSITLNELAALIASAVDVPPPRLRLPAWPLLTAAALCEALCRPLRIEPPLHRRRADFFIKNRAFTTARARQVLGFLPRISPEEGLRQTAAWYAQQGLLAPVPASQPTPPPVAQEVGT